LFLSRITQKLLNRFSQKFGRKVAHGPHKKRLDFGDNTDKKQISTGNILEMIPSASQSGSVIQFTSLSIFNRLFIAPEARPITNRKISSSETQPLTPLSGNTLIGINSYRGSSLKVSCFPCTWKILSHSVHNRVKQTDR